MSSKFKVLNIALVAVLALGVFTATTKADVTGNFGIHIMVVPQTTVSEIAPLLIDFQNELNLTYVVSGLSTTFHTHFGVAGVEDVILTTAATLGALDLSTTLVFGRFAFGQVDPFYDTLHFIKKRVTASVSLGGVTFTNLAVIEDVNAFGALAGMPVAVPPVAPTTVPGLGILLPQSSIYAFGDILTVSGQTPSGIGLTFQTAICMEATPNLIKKHFLAPNSINPECVSFPKPDLLFDFETISITGVPIAAGVTASGTVSCVTITACVLTTSFTFNTPSVPIPFTSTFSFTDLTSLAFSGADLVFNAGAGTLVISIDPTGTIAATSVTINATLNPDTNPATLIIAGTIVPGTGLTSAVVEFAITRLGFTMSATASFGGGPPATFQGISFNVDVPGGLVNFEASTTFTLTGMTVGEFWITVNF
jgi:hypothetical protein